MYFFIFYQQSQSNQQESTKLTVKMLKFNKITVEIIEINNILNPFLGLILKFE